MEQAGAWIKLLAAGDGAAIGIRADVSDSVSDDELNAIREFLSHTESVTDDGFRGCSDEQAPSAPGIARIRPLCLLRC